MLAHRILYSKFFESPFKNAYMAGDFPAILVSERWSDVSQRQRMSIHATMFRISRQLLGAIPAPFSRGFVSLKCGVLIASRFMQVNNFVRRSKDDGKGQNNKLFNAYFGHREISYGVSEMMKVRREQHRRPFCISTWGCYDRYCASAVNAKPATPLASPVAPSVLTDPALRAPPHN